MFNHQCHSFHYTCDHQFYERKPDCQPGGTVLNESIVFIAADVILEKKIPDEDKQKDAETN
jgi:hypothetical protein